jgi:hypothetical protein
MELFKHGARWRWAVIAQPLGVNRPSERTFTHTGDAMVDLFSFLDERFDEAGLSEAFEDAMAPLVKW